MRRLLSTAMLLLLGLPLIAPLFALDAGAESNLPACCRMHGRHHCMMSAEETEALLSGERVPSLRSQCPWFPRPASALAHQTLALEQPALLFAEVLSHPAQHRQTEAWARVALEGARHKRGPPSIRLS